MTSEHALTTRFLAETSLSLHTDCVAYEPTSRILAVTCYQLNEADETAPGQKREGYVAFYRIVFETPDKWALQALAVTSTIDGTSSPRLACSSGVFDLRWSPQPTSCSREGVKDPILTLALADGTTQRFQVSSDQETAPSPADGGTSGLHSSLQVAVTKLETFVSENIDDMAIGVDVARHSLSEDVDEDEVRDKAASQELTSDSQAAVRPTYSELVSVGYQTGGVAVWDIERPSQPLWSCPDAHLAEVWQTQFLVDYNCDPRGLEQAEASQLATPSKIVASDPTAFGSRISNLLVSGSDDASFKIWDMRADPSRGASMQNTKHYQMGVTSFASPMASPCRFARSMLPSTLLIGSYDESLSLWDFRQMKKPVASIGLGGGVWRIRWLPTSLLGGDLATQRRPLLSVACMHAGFQVVGVGADGAGFSLESLAKYWGPHTGSVDGKFPPLAYGVDWIGHYSPERPEHLLAGCTFYDNRVSIWSAAS